MTDEYHVDIAALERDAARFTEWSTALETMAEALPLGVSTAEFSSLPGAATAHASLLASAAALRDFLSDGSAQFTAIAEKLESSAQIYTEAEQASMDDVAKVARELDSL